MVSLSRIGSLNDAPILARSVVGVTGPHVSSLVTRLLHDTPQDAGDLAFASRRKVGMEVFLVAPVGDVDPPVSRYRVRIHSLGWGNRMLPLFLHFVVHD